MSRAQSAWHLKGNATGLAGGCIQLTSATTSQAGAAWNTKKLNIKKGFDLAYKMYFGTNTTTGADGIVFVLHQDSTGLSAIGDGGGSMGWAKGISGTGIHPSVGVEMDTYDNEPSVPDSSWNHMALIINGNLQNQLQGPIPALPSKAHIDDGKYHIFRIKYNDTTHQLQAWFDCNLRIHYRLNMDSAIFKKDSMVYYGFTGGTGGLDNVQQFCPIQPKISTGKQIYCCYGYSVKLTGTKDTGYYWTPSYALSCTKCATTTASPTVNTTYYYKSDIKCLNIEDSIAVTITSLALGSHSFFDTSVCLGTPVQLSINDAHHFKVKGTIRDSIVDTGIVYFTPLKSGIDTIYFNHHCRYPDTLYYSIKINNADSTHVDAAICKGQRYTLPKGTFVYLAGQYIDTFKNMYGCDSVVHTSLTIHPLSYFTQNVFICNGKTYTLPHGEMANIAGVYRDTFVNTLGCDSVVTTGLHLQPVFNLYDTVIICTGQQAVLHKGERVSVGGIYVDTFLNHKGCDSIYHSFVSIISPPIVLPHHYLLCYYDSVLLTNPIEGAGYVWNNGNTAAGIYVSKGGYYIVQITMPPCPAVPDTFYIHMKQCDTLLNLPDAFTPNNDGINDKFYPIYLGGIVVTSFKIYNRWGLMIYDNPKAPWDGTYAGVNQPQGTYYYIVEAAYTAGIHTYNLIKKGDVELLR